MHNRLFVAVTLILAFSAPVAAMPEVPHQWEALARELLGSSVIRVGNDESCDFASIQEAINEIEIGESGVVLVNSGTYHESVAWFDRGVLLWGGYAGCDDNDRQGVSTIDASGTEQSALGFGVSLAVDQLLWLSRFELTGGSGLVEAHRGGGLSVFTSQAGRATNVILQRTAVIGNSSSGRGGGVALHGQGGGSLTIMDGSRIGSNTVAGKGLSAGGGLYCEGNYHIEIIGGTIHDNVAGVENSDSNSGGGGMFLSGCDLAWWSDEAATLGDEAALRDNVANGAGLGGGILAEGGAIVRLIGAHRSDTIPEPVSTRPLLIHGNRAEGELGGGGAFMALNADTEITVDRSWIYDNHAESIGGALYIVGATVVIERSRESCHRPRDCSRISGNSAGDFGGAAFVDIEGAELTVRHTRLRDNGGSIPFEVHSGTRLILEDSLLFGDVNADHVFDVNQSQLIIRRSTIADTRPKVSVFRLAGDPDVKIPDAGGVTSSIIHESDGSAMVLAAGPVLFEHTCMLWHDDGLIEFGTSTDNATQVADPLFVDRAAGLYYLTPESPAINVCAQPGPLFDLDWNPRGIEHSGQPITTGPYDVGAYELPLQVFDDRFEE